MDVTKEIRKYMIEMGKAPINITVDSSLRCDNCGKTLLITTVGENYWIELKGVSLILECCSEKILQQGGIFFLSDEDKHM